MKEKLLSTLHIIIVAGVLGGTFYLAFAHLRGLEQDAYEAAPVTTEVAPLTSDSNNE